MKRLRAFSLQTRLTVLFSLVMAAIILTASLSYSLLVRRIRQSAFDKMQAQAEFYRETFERQVDLTLAQQQEIYSNRKLPFVMRPNSGLSAYEERDAMLSIREWMRTVTDLTDFADRGKLFLPLSGYYLSNSTVRVLSQEDRDRLDQYLLRGTSGILYDGADFYSIVTDVPDPSARSAGYALVITFSTRKISEAPSLFGAVDNGGTFVYNSTNDVMLCGSGGETLARQLWDNLRRQDGQIVTAQRVQAGGKYLVLMGGDSTLGTFVLYLDEQSAAGYIWKYWLVVPLFILLAAGMALSFAAYTRRRLYMPLNVLIGAFAKVKEGYPSQRIHHDAGDEFSFIYEEFNDLEERTERLIRETYLDPGKVVIVHGKDAETAYSGLTLPL